MLQRCLIVLVLWIAAAASARCAESGVFPARTWDIRQIRLGDDYPDPPFYALAQSHEGLIYAGDRSGLLEFDGRNWRRFPLPTQAAVSVLGVTRAGALVVGGAEFLYVIADPRDPERIVDVAKALPSGLHGSGDFWEFAEDSEQWCVRAPALLVCGNAAGFRSYPAQHGYGRLFQARNSMLIEVDRVGLSRITSRGPALVVGGEAFVHAGITSLVEFTDGVVFAITKNPLAAWQWRHGQAPLMTRAIPETELKPQLGIGLIAATERIALPEDNGGVTIVDRDGHAVDHVDPADLGVGAGAQALLVDSEGALWIAWRSAISRVEYPSRMRVFPLPAALFGQNLSLTRTRLGLTTWYGDKVLVLRKEATSGRWTFEQHGPGLPSILTIGSHQGTDFAGTVSGIRSLQSKTNLLDGELVFATAAVLGQPDDLWVGRRNGVSRLSLRAARWHESSRSARLSFDVSSVLQADATTLWLGSLVGRVARVRLGADGTLANAAIDEFDQTLGLPRATILLERINDAVLFWAQGDGFHEFRDGRFVPSEMVPIAETGSIGEARLIGDAQLLVSSPSSQLRLLKRDITGVYRYQPSVFDEIAGSEKTRSLHVDPDGSVWLAKDSGLIRIDPRMQAPKPRPQQVLLRDVTAGDVRLFNGRGPSPVLQLAEGASVRFGYTLPSYRAPELNRYRSRIRSEAEPSAWSAWSNETQRDFTNLPAGKLLFEVEAQDAAGVSGGTASVPLTVIAPWYRRSWAIGLFAIGAALLVYAGMQWRVRALRARSAELERLVAIKTEALQVAANTDPLTGLWNRHRFGHWLRSELIEINARAGVARAEDPVDLIVCLIDLDHFKRVNDLHGHAAGDLVLKAVADRLREFMRADDLIFRFGGEEFVFIGKCRHRSDGRALANAIVDEIGQITVELPGGVRLDPTASLGWSVYPFYRERADLFSLDFVLGVADRALYLAKRDGRNLACGYLPNIAADEIDRTQSDWRSQVFNRHPDFLKQV